MFRKLRHLAIVSVVWLTATSVALATFPRVDCVCPNGRTKVFCLDAQFGWCFRAADKAAEAPRRSCCHKGVEQPTPEELVSFATGSSTDGESIKRTGCTKIFVAPALTSATSPQNQFSQEIAQAWSLWLDHDVATHSPGIVAVRFDAFVPHSRPPSVDLTILLQQFRN
jgi:hypothetical protein